MQNAICIVTIPPHTFHRIQPLDLFFFGPLKAAYNNECDKFLRSHPGERITTNEVTEHFNRAFRKIAVLNIFVNAHEKHLGGKIRKKTAENSST